MRRVALLRVSKLRFQLPEHCAQLASQHGKTAQLLIETLQLCRGKRANLAARCPALFADFQEPCQLIQSEPHGNGVLHEPNAISGLRGVLAVAVAGAFGMEKASALIVAKRVGAEAAEPGQLRRAQVAAGIVIFHNYGI